MKQESEIIESLTYKLGECQETCLDSFLSASVIYQDYIFPLRQKIFYCKVTIWVLVICIICLLAYYPIKNLDHPQITERIALFIKESLCQAIPTIKKDISQYNEGHKK